MPALFPKSKGWDFYLKSLYPNGYQFSLFVGAISTDEECLIFVPIDDLPTERDLGAILNMEVRKSIVNGINPDIKKVQVILVTSEKYEQGVVDSAKKSRIKCSVLIHRYDRVEFAHGGFTNPRLEYRLSRYSFDPDLTTGTLITNQFIFGDRVQKLFFMQSVFHLLDSAWISGTEKLPIREVVGNVLPCWKQYRRSEQQAIIQSVEQDLKECFTRYFDGWASLDRVSKKARANPETVICLPTKSKTKKNLNSWIRAQKQALDFLCHHDDPIVIDEADFKGVI